MQKYNLGGYICLKFSVIFGTLILLAMIGLFPLVKRMTEKMPTKRVNVAASLLLLVVLLDFFVQWMTATA